VQSKIASSSLNTSTDEIYKVAFLSPEAFNNSSSELQSLGHFPIGSIIKIQKHNFSAKISCNSAKAEKALA
jgi:hypothetical protein